MDVLSYVLLTIRLQGTPYLVSETSPEWCYLAPRPQSASEKSSQDARSMLAFSLLLQGSCAVLLPGQSPMSMKPGDLLLSPPGDGQVLASSLAALDSLRPKQLQLDVPWSTVSPGDGATGPSSDESGATTLIGGHIACEDVLMLTLAATRSVLRVVGEEQSRSWMLSSLKQARLFEHGSIRPGAAVIIERFVELIVLEALRLHSIESNAAMSVTGCYHGGC